MHVCAGLLKQTGEAASALMPDGLVPDLFDDLDPLDLDLLDSGLLDGVSEGVTMVTSFLSSAVPCLRVLSLSERGARYGVGLLCKGSGFQQLQAKLPCMLYT